MSPPLTTFASDKSNTDNFPQSLCSPAISRINAKSAPLISPTIFRLVSLYFLLLPILSDKVPACSNLTVICFVIKSSSAAWIERQPNNINMTNKSCRLKVKFLISLFLKFIFFLLLEFLLAQLLLALLHHLF